MINLVKEEGDSESGAVSISHVLSGQGSGVGTGVSSNNTGASGTSVDHKSDVNRKDVS